MPGYRVEVGPEVRPLVKARLVVTDRWENMSAEERLLYNRATRAINNLCDYYQEQFLGMVVESTNPIKAP